MGNVSGAVLFDESTEDKLERARDLIEQALADESLTLPNGRFMVEELTRAVEALRKPPASTQPDSVV